MACLLLWGFSILFFPLVASSYSDEFHPLKARRLNSPSVPLLLLLQRLSPSSQLLLLNCAFLIRPNARCDATSRFRRHLLPFSTFPFKSQLSFLPSFLPSLFGSCWTKLIQSRTRNLPNRRSSSSSSPDIAPAILQDEKDSKSQRSSTDATFHSVASVAG